MISAALASIEAKSKILEALPAIIDAPDFKIACIIAKACKGKFVLAGIGKSGHIARKIAATMTSVGMPAVFLHPGEAAHGDMGMICPGDCLLMFSHSGETDELRPILNFAIRLGVPSIVITSRADSFLGKVTGTVIAYPRMDEGCPVGRAPMASTVAQMSIGDALAAAVMAERGFTREDFDRFHHGGYLKRDLAAVA